MCSSELWGVLSIGLLASRGAWAGTVIEGTRARETCADRVSTRRAFFGDLHVHTSFSLDASTMGTRTRPSDAYRFAWGERIGIQPFSEGGRPTRSVRLERPLDFAAVTDHAELLGETRICNSPGMHGYDSMVCRIFRNWPRVAFFWMNAQASRGQRHDFCGDDGSICLEASRIPWQENWEATEAAYDRSAACHFTSFHAYEWTGGAGMGNNFHRNVIFANDIVPDIPLSFIEAPKLVDFWSGLGKTCRDAESGCDVLVIPHNSNLSAGKMFRTQLPDGSPIGRIEAKGRADYELLVEIMQHKGESECMFGLETEDELCRFEKLEQNSFAGRFFPATASPPVARQFIRNVLKEGLRIERRLNVNPFKFGVIASTDTHLGTPGLTDESSSFPGHGGAGKPADNQLARGFPDHVDFNPGGLAVIWADENSRHALFEGMRRKETYGTSGPRIEVRFFGGWDYPQDLCDDEDFARKGYAGGVPMGGDLAPPPDPRAAPSFVSMALADPGTQQAPGNPLQRLQIIKGWVDDEGHSHQAIYEVAGDPHNRASVDLDSCETHGRGFAQLCSVWTDPDFDPDRRAVYYMRVVENPSCRYNAWQCIGLAGDLRPPECDDPERKRTIQERAWTSPIWYTPPV